MLSTLFIGNPGTGKSSTMNCYLNREGGEACFSSGISKSGAGLTYQLDEKEHDGQMWMDTPGLSCLKHRKAAAAAINTALKRGGAFRIVFVLTIESGRVRPDDITTISLVMEACNSQEPQIGDDQYAILINKTSNNWLGQMDQASREDWKRNNFSTLLREKGIKTTKIVHFAPFVEEMNDANNKLVPLCPQTRLFIDQLPVFHIDPQKLEEVNADDWDDKCRQINEVTEKNRELEEERDAIRKQADADRDAMMREKARAAQLEHDRKKEAKAAASARADADAASRRHEEELEKLGRRGNITANIEGDEVGGAQLWGGAAEEIVMVNDTRVAVAFSAYPGKHETVSAKSRVSRDWAFNAVLFWATPDVTVSWSAATDPEQSGSMLVKAGQVLRLSQ